MNQPMRASTRKHFSARNYEIQENVGTKLCSISLRFEDSFHLGALTDSVSNKVHTHVKIKGVKNLKSMLQKQPILTDKK